MKFSNKIKENSDKNGSIDFLANKLQQIIGVFCYVISILLTRRQSGQNTYVEINEEGWEIFLFIPKYRKLQVEKCLKCRFFSLKSVHRLTLIFFSTFVCRNKTYAYMPHFGFGEIIKGK